VDSGIDLRNKKVTKHLIPVFVASIVFNFGKDTEILHPQAKPLDENQTWDRLFGWVSGHMTLSGHMFLLSQSFAMSKLNVCDF